MNYITFLYLILIFVQITACKLSSQTEETHKADSSNSFIDQSSIDNCNEFNRNGIIKRLDFKKENKIPLIVHIFVPLCDNKHQGIVPVSKSLGDGANLTTNLYWGAGYGIKTYFKRRANWKLIYTQKDINKDILERAIFSRLYNSKIKVILIADAYKGDKMEACLHDFFNALAGIENDIIYLVNDTIHLKSNTDLLIFNGHNGLMDMNMEFIGNEDGIEKDVAVISCLSSSYFMEHLKCLKAYPLITTQDFLPPEAYVAEGIIDAWALQKTEEEIRLNTGNAMFKVFKRNQKAMQGIFKSGW